MHPWVKKRRQLQTHVNRRAVTPAEKREMELELARETDRPAASPYSGKALFDPVSWDLLIGLHQFSSAEAPRRAYTSSELEQLYCTHSVIYACVRKIVAAASEATPRIGRDHTAGFEPLADHLLLRLLRRPNREMSYADFLGHFLTHLLVTGESFLWERRNRAGFIDELWPMPTSWVTPRGDPSSGRLLHYEIRQLNKNRAPLRVPPADMTVVRFPDPAHPGRACGPLMAAARDVQLDDERENYLAEMLANLKAPGLVLYQPDGWTPPQRDAARAVLADTVGRGQRGSPLFLEGESARVDMIAPLKDLDWPGLTSLNETRICATFGVPPIVIGLRSGLEHGTYANFEQAERSFYRGTMPPLWRMLEDAFTRGLLQDEGEHDLVLRFDTSSVKQLQEDTNERARRARGLFAAGLATRNEARNIAGLTPLAPERGDVLAAVTTTSRDPQRTRTTP